MRGRGVGLLPQLRSLLSYPTVLQRGSEQPQPRPSQQGPPADATSGSTVSVGDNPPTSRVAAMGEEEHRRLWIREASTRPSSRCPFKHTSFSSRGRC